MSNLLLSFEENTNGSRTAPADGSGVTAWLTTAVIQNPQDGYYPTVGSPDASGTTSGGACTLSGLSGSDAYWVCIVDAGTQSHWFKVGVGSAGSGTTYPFTYVPSPVAETTPTPALTQIGGRIFLGAYQTGLSSPTLVGFDEQDFAVGGVAATFPDISVGPAGLYVVTASVLLVGTDASAGYCEMFVANGGAVNGQASAYASGTGLVGLNFSDVWNLDENTTVEVKIITPDDSAYQIFGVHPATDFSSNTSLAVAYVGGTIS